MINKINFDEIKKSLISDEVIRILSTDNDKRFFEAKEILKKEVPNIEYILIDEKFMDQFPGKKDLFNLYKKIRGEKQNLESLEKGFKNSNIFSNLLLKSGWASGIVSGATHPTSDILRPAFQIVKTKEPGVVSSFIWMSKEGTKDMFMSDISVMPNPDAQQLAQIAIQTANSVEKIFKIKPVVAMLSFSTNGSGGKDPSVLKVKEATLKVKEAGIEVYGDIQWDAATKVEIFKKKMNLDEPKEMPNVFIFPDLNSGNIGYKIAAGLGGFNAVGPILQNISSPVNDLSRGCASQEIADLVVITATQIKGMEGK